TVGGRPLEASRSYSVATDVFLADGGDGYSMLVGARDRVERQIPMRDLLLQAVRAKPLTASLDGRIRAVGRDLAPHPSAHPGH
ncbi:MAG: 5'-nucleotidase C-terminal domain-containing protein, partial [Nitrospiraceae bacterium]